MTDSRRWLEYFRSNQGDPEEIPWDEAIAPPSAAARRALVASLQQFQLGENASGLHFLARARQHGAESGDPDFPEAIALFIAEEQRHSAMLARYLRAIGAPLLAEHWIHGAFRWLRHRAGLESMVTVLVTAETISVPYYRALLESTRCPALAAICRRVLREEAQHLLFQGNTLRRLQRARPGWWRSATHWAQELLLAGTCLAVWREHAPVFRAAGDGRLDVWYTARIVLQHVQRAASGANPLAYGAAPVTRMPVSQ